MSWNIQAVIVPPLLYVVIAEKDKAKHLKRFLLSTVAKLCWTKCPIKLNVPRQTIIWPLKSWVPSIPIHLNLASVNSVWKHAHAAIVLIPSKVYVLSDGNPDHYSCHWKSVPIFWVKKTPETIFDCSWFPTHAKISSWHWLQHISMRSAISLDSFGSTSWCGLMDKAPDFGSFVHISTNWARQNKFEKITYIS